MKKIFLLLITIVIALPIIAQRTDFSGSWLLNMNDTKFGPVPKWILPKSVVLRQDHSKLTIVKEMFDQKGVFMDSVVESLRFDGTLLLNTAFGNQYSAHLKWIDDKTVSITRESKTGPNAGSQTVEEMKLGENDNTLIINRSVEQMDGKKYSLTLYFNRK